MSSEPPKSARDEILEKAAADRPAHDSARDSDRIVDSALRLLGNAPQSNAKEAIDGRSQAKRSRLEILGGPREDAPTERSEERGLRQLVGSDASLPPGDDPAPKTASGESSSSIQDGSVASPNDLAGSNSDADGITGDEHRTQDASGDEPSQDALDLDGDSGATDLPTGREQSFDAQADPELQSEASPKYAENFDPSWAPDASVSDDRQPDRVEPLGDVAQPLHSEAATDQYAPPVAITDTSRESSVTVTDTSKSSIRVLPPWPILNVDVKDVNRVVQSELDAFSRRLERLAVSIAKKEVDAHEYREFAQERALYWEG